MKKIQLLISSLLLTSGLLLGQQKYDDFSGNKFQNFGTRDGILDSASVTPKPNNVNSSPKCAKYVRLSTTKYDNIKIYPQRKLVNVSSYATHLGNPLKMKMKIYTSAPIGTKIELQLGKKGDDNYPTGVHSQYEAFTTVQNAWEELTFTFSQIPKGSLVAATDIDKITVLFAPNSSSGDAYYFDDLTGPELVPESTPARASE